MRPILKTNSRAAGQNWQYWYPSGIILSMNDPFVQAYRELERQDRPERALAYMNLRLAIRHLIERGGLRIGQPLPSERELAERLGLSRVTVRKALAGLVEEGQLTQRRGAHLRRRAHRQVHFAPDQLQRRPAVARPQSALGVLRARRRRSHPGGGDGAQSLARRGGGAPAPPALRRRRAAGDRAQRHPAQPAAGSGTGHPLALRGLRPPRLPPGARAAAPARGGLRQGAGAPARRR